MKISNVKYSEDFRQCLRLMSYAIEEPKYPNPEQLELPEPEELEIVKKPGKFKFK